MRKQHGDGVRVFRITGARTGLAEDVRGRQRRYVISMTIRTLSVILAVSLWNVERYVAIVALVLGALLPYVAVVIANAGREKPPSLPSTFVTRPMRTVIMPPQAEEEQAEDEQAESVAEDVSADSAAGMHGKRSDHG
ncbi:DUF3099 domain-containing protein [Streptomyces pluripotens]|uniref:DUF3099 domain-containing protein n=1 Tax=Streptomyces pluripotens TaxID=1355015 RepID=A0A221NVA3_9ACTN|nr:MULTISPECIES: DUF3099 domain-containing protein [Streptomyces]ARP69573.1 hypothetical protein LK06_006025 [Streptomyces pluripotens]ASN23832.1 DUF3099 domain-containing protein [Streptomyces pluripotens]KIE24498.1 membrane protein [Streptomyces sp. MUSC 125]MCH0558675.1 DUF3099 domain-containing protein [Streptomyces sp. MUM 16J]